MTSLTSLPVPSELGFKDVGTDEVHTDFPLRDGDVVCLRSTLTEDCATRFYVDAASLARHSRAFRDMIDMVKESQGNESVIQMTEDVFVLELLCEAIGEDTKEFPDLFATSVDTVVGRYAASLKYGMPSVQVLAEHAIR